MLDWANWEVCVTIRSIREQDQSYKRMRAIADRGKDAHVRKQPLKAARVNLVLAQLQMRNAPAQAHAVERYRQTRRPLLSPMRDEYSNTTASRMRNFD